MMLQVFLSTGRFIRGAIHRTKFLEYGGRGVLQNAAELDVPEGY